MHEYICLEVNRCFPLIHLVLKHYCINNNLQICGKLIAHKITRYAVILWYDYQYIKRLGRCRIAHVTTRTEDICILAVSRYFEAINSIKIQTDKICIAAINNSYRSLNYIKNQTDELCVLSLSKSSNAIKFIKNQKEEFCILALNRNYKTIKHIKEQYLTYNVLKHALHITSKSIKFLNETYNRIKYKNIDKIYIMAIDIKPKCIKYISNLSSFNNVILYVFSKYPHIMTTIKSFNTMLSNDIIKNIINNFCNKTNVNIYNVLFNMKKNISSYNMSKTLEYYVKLAKYEFNTYPHFNKFTNMCFVVYKKYPGSLELLNKQELTNNIILSFVEKYPASLIQFKRILGDIDFNIYKIIIPKNVITIKYLLDMYKNEQSGIKIKVYKIINTYIKNIQNNNDNLYKLKKIIDWYPCGLLLIDNPQDELCKSALSKDLSILPNIKNIPEITSINIVSINGLLLQYINNQTLDICMTAIKNNIFALKYVNIKFIKLILLFYKKYGKKLNK